jgi:uracil DNA glycosylase
VLTVELGQAASHQGKGWEKFTDAVIELVARQERPIVFILWGCLCAEEGGVRERYKPGRAAPRDQIRAPVSVVGA